MKIQADQIKDWFEKMREKAEQQQRGQGPQPEPTPKPEKERKFKAPKKFFIASVIILALLLYYFLLPPLNLHSPLFWFTFFVLGVYATLTLGIAYGVFKKMALVLGGIFLVLVLLNVTSLELFRAKSYASILVREPGDFTADIQEIPVDRIPTVDRDTAERLGSRKMGELIDLVSQFNIDNSYTQINYKGDPVRVTPLEYNGFLKWLSNQSKGIPNFILVNMVNGDAHLNKLTENIKYSKSDLFFRDIGRHMRINHPTAIFENIVFEIDDNGTPYWIAGTYKPRISWFGAMDINGAILCNAITGETEFYPVGEIPNWVDRVYSAQDIITQLNWNGKYQSGFFNSIFSQKGVLQTTEGYNYLALNDDVYLYTGFTSMGTDESNVGFVLVNLRTKETKFYPVSSAEEFSAMESAEGEVQEKNYKATFPLLLNINGSPTYFMSLKDNAGLIKMYAFVDAQNYQNVSIGQSVESAYRIHLGEKHFQDLENQQVNADEIQLAEGTIEAIFPVVLEGTTNYYLKLAEGDQIYIASLILSDYMPFYVPGDYISFEYYQTTEGSNQIITIKGE